MKHLVRAAVVVLLTAIAASANDMPDIVARGRKPHVRPCRDCHLSNGFGRPGTASLAGLTPGYISKQLADYRRGVRRSASLEDDRSEVMRRIATAIDASEIDAAARYFSAIELKPWIRIVETARVPAAEDSPAEPLGWRVVERRVDQARPSSSPGAFAFVAYVPVGSVKKGKELVTTGKSGRTMRCAQCHGEHLRGDGAAPPIAGRSPGYLIRQLTDMKAGTRRDGGDLMMGALARLTDDDFVAVAAYVSSLAP